MRAVVQRVTNAHVTSNGEMAGRIQKGLMVLLGVEQGDTEKDAVYMAGKIVKLRIFEDENGKMNRSVTDMGGQALVVSQFTLLANYAHGNRPDYLNSEKPDRANQLYEYFVSLMREGLSHVGTGIFGADMEVTIVNDGPVTIVMDSEVLKKKH